MPKLAKYLPTINDTYTVNTSTQQDSTIDPTHAVTTHCPTVVTTDCSPAATTTVVSNDCTTDCSTDCSTVVTPSPPPKMCFGSKRPKNRSCHPDRPMSCFVEEYPGAEQEQTLVQTLEQQIQQSGSLDKFLREKSLSSAIVSIHSSRRRHHVYPLGPLYYLIKSGLDKEKDSNYPMIACPHKGNSQNSHCGYHMTLPTIAHSLRKFGEKLDQLSVLSKDRELHTELLDIVERSIITSHKKNGNWFCCPNTSCSNSSGFADLDRLDRVHIDSHRVTCYKCGLDFCAQCSTVHKSYEPCSRQSTLDKCFRSIQATGEYANAEEFAKCLGTEYQMCPNTKCNTAFPKDGHCDHVTCTNCNTQFCFGCGSHWILRTGDTHAYQHLVLLPRQDKAPPATRGGYLCTTFIIDQARYLLGRQAFTESDSWIVHAVFSIHNIFSQFSRDEIQTLAEIEINIGVTDEIRSDPSRLASHRRARGFELDSSYDMQFYS